MGGVTTKSSSPPLVLLPPFVLSAGCLSLCCASFIVSPRGSYLASPSWGSCGCCNSWHVDAPVVDLHADTRGAASYPTCDVRAFHGPGLLASAATVGTASTGGITAWGGQAAKDAGSAIESSQLGLSSVPSLSLKKGGRANHWLSTCWPRARPGRPAAETIVLKQLLESTCTNVFVTSERHVPRRTLGEGTTTTTVPWYTLLIVLSKKLLMVRPFQVCVPCMGLVSTAQLDAFPALYICVLSGLCVFAVYSRNKCVEVATTRAVIEGYGELVRCVLRTSRFSTCMAYRRARERPLLL